MSDPVQRLTALPDTRLISPTEISDGQAGVQIRALFHKHPVQRPQDLDFTMPLRAIASFPDSRNWDTKQDIEELPRIWHPFRKAGRYILIVLGGGGSSLIAERLAPEEPLTPMTPVRVHPHALHVSLNRGLEIDGIRFALEASTHTTMSRIDVVRDPGKRPRLDHTLPDPEQGPDITPAQAQMVVAHLDREIIAFGEMLSAAYAANRGETAGWPSELCRHVMPHKERAAEMARLIKATCILAYDKFVEDDTKSLLVTIYVANRPHPLIGKEREGWNTFVNLRDTITPDDMKDWIEATLRKATAVRWPQGWYEVAGPATKSRLGVDRQMRHASHEVKGPISNHQKIAAMAALAQVG